MSHNAGGIMNGNREGGVQGDTHEFQYASDRLRVLEDSHATVFTICGLC